MDREEVLALHREYWDNHQSLVSIAARIGTSHETVRQLFMRQGLQVRSHAQAAAHERERRQALVEQHKGTIIALYKEHGTIALVMEHLPVELPRKLVTEVIDAIADRESYRRRNTAPRYPEERLILDLHKAREHCGEPLSGPAYQKVARELGLVSFDTQVSAFGSFADALNAAGVRGNEPRGRRAGATTPEQCIAAVAQYLDESTGRPSYPRYEQWARGKDVPSGATVRKVVGGWQVAKEQATNLDRRR